MTPKPRHIPVMKGIKSLSLAEVINEPSKKAEKQYIFETTSPNFNKLLNGGFLSGKTYLVFGANSTGKTQLCHYLCLESYKNEGTTIFVDTENTFRPERIKELSLNNGLKPKEVLKSVMVANVMSNETLLMNLSETQERIVKDKVKLLVIDSLNNYFRIDLGNNDLSFFSTRNKFLKILKKISELTDTFQLVTILTAQVSPRFIKNLSITEKPVGVQYLTHYFSEFIYLSLDDDGKTHAHVVNSNYLPERKVIYVITEVGIEDYSF